MAELHVFRGEEPLARAAAERVIDAAAAAVEARGRFRLGLSGGTTPLALYRALASDTLRGSLDWSRVWVVFADERAVPPDDPQSNYRAAQENLLGVVGVPREHVHRMHGEHPDLEAAAQQYETYVAEPLDLLILGIGEDAHVASIFPGSPLVMERIRRVAAVLDSPKPPPRRLTVTPRVIREARQVMTLATGPGKTSAVARALEGDTDMRQYPARMLREVVWYVDRAASAALKEPGSES
jgi:6-phosphogluconolactonase